jgi:hypothetical protein
LRAPGRRGRGGRSGSPRRSRQGGEACQEAREGLRAARQGLLALSHNQDGPGLYRLGLRQVHRIVTEVDHGTAGTAGVGHGQTSPPSWSPPTDDAAFAWPPTIAAVLDVAAGHQVRRGSARLCLASVWDVVIRVGVPAEGPNPGQRLRSRRSRACAHRYPASVRPAHQAMAAMAVRAFGSGPDGSGDRSCLLRMRPSRSGIDD